MSLLDDVRAEAESLTTPVPDVFRDHLDRAWRIGADPSQIVLMWASLRADIDIGDLLDIAREHPAEEAFLAAERMRQQKMTRQQWISRRVTIKKA